MSVFLPPETWQEICARPELSQGELVKVLYTCKSLAEIAKPFLYRSTHICLGANPWTKHTLVLLRTDKRLARAVRALSISGHWNGADDRRELLECLFKALTNMDSLWKVKIGGEVFSSVEEHVRFYNHLAQHCQPRSLHFGSGVKDCTTHALDSFRLSTLIVDTGAYPLPAQMLQSLLNGSRPHLVHISLPFCYRTELPWPFWTLHFPKLKTLSIDGDGCQMDCMVPPEGEVTDFLHDHLESLEHLEYTGFGEVVLGSSQAAPRCRVKLASHPRGDHLFLVREMETRLDIACRMAEQDPAFAAEALESLTLVHREDSSSHQGLDRLLVLLFRRALKPIDYSCIWLNTLVCRFDHPISSDREEEEKRVQKTFSVLRDIAGLCGPRLLHLSGILPPYQILAKDVAENLCGFPNLCRLGMYQRTVGCANGRTMEAYAVELKRRCGSLTMVEMFRVDGHLADKEPSPIYIVNL